MNKQLLSGYCERAHDPGFWAEPWNAVTNAAFILAALACLLIARRSGRLDGPVLWLIALMMTIGTGSFLFHTFATVWAAIADSGPIMLFILSYFTIAMRCFVGVGWGRALLLTLGFLAALVAMSYPLNLLLRDIIGGSISYVPAGIALFAVGAWLRTRGHPAGNWLVAAAGVFLISLTCRALDVPSGTVCMHFPTGTHFLWHILNGVVLGTLTLAVIRHGHRDPA